MLLFPFPSSGRTEETAATENRLAGRDQTRTGEARRDQARPGKAIGVVS